VPYFIGGIYSKVERSMQINESEKNGMNLI